MTATDLVVTNDVHQLERLTPSAQEASVTLYLTEARNKLAQAVEMTGPAAVAAVRAEIATAADATKHLGLSREIQADAQEMVRRAEYALGKAIRASQERGELSSLATKHNGPRSDYTRTRNGVEEQVQVPGRDTTPTLPSPREFFGHGEEQQQVYAMADNVTDEQFDAALAEAKDEGNVSRANVVRKIKGAADDRTKKSVYERVEWIKRLAPSGMTSQQIGKQIGVGEEYVRKLARDADVDIPADRVMRGTRRLDHTRAVAKTVEMLDALASNLDFDPAQVDWASHEDWVASLTDSMKKLVGFVSNVRKGPNVH